MKIFLGIFVMMFCVASCVPPSTYRSSYTYDKPSFSPTTHTYELNVIDIDGFPVSRATVEYTTKDRGTEVKTEKVTLDLRNPVLKTTISATSDPRWSWFDYSTELEFKVSANGYYSSSGRASSTYGSRMPTTSYSSGHSMSSSKDPVQVTVNLYKPIDHFSSEFLTMEKDDKLKQKVIAFVDLIKLQGYLSDAYLDYKSINTTDFKGKKYNITSATKYMNRCQIVL